MQDQPTIAAAIDQVAPRLRQARERKGVSLADLRRATGISTSTLSRLESGQRRPSLELLLPITAALDLRLDDIVSAPRIVDPPPPTTKDDGRVLVPLTRHHTEPRAFKMTIPAADSEPRTRTHPGHEWLYVLHGRLRVVLGSLDVVLGPGEAAEFDCRTPHWFGSTGTGPVEVLSVFGRHGQRIQLRARTTR
ncbi:helix-turn-helix domain-containing protein [Saccharothrix variisporea]|uniref:XRE family transcriptional regulator n=1 Tax=Saccharothrix variisporea TaxID=543527 RepID=A0A495XFK2_9PSEU|nr:XRE family transcriptional regulator [Saccharothrix variisporea]RKT70338.1 XRE family transcriptional regulator [Saccharothrix variisporea]